MPHDLLQPSRRAILASLAALGAVGPFRLRPAAASTPILTRPYPATGERIPVVGMGTWITFNVGDDTALRDQRTEVLRTFFELGGGLIDSSPMYGTSEAVVGYGLARLGIPQSLFAATKVWTLLQAMGPGQMEASRAHWGVERFDLMQVHNLLNWEGHLETLRAMRAEGRVRSIGITTSHGSRHDTFARIMETQPIDAVQFTYNVLDREAERRLLPLAAERDLAVIVNRPFRQGALIRAANRHPLPDFAAEIDCANWAQLLLKFVIAHPAVTCVIPATTRIEHMRQNMGALHGPLPDEDLRARIVRHVENF